MSAIKSVSNKLPILVKNITQSTLKNNTIYNDIISKRNIALWQYNCLNPQTVTLDIQFLLSSSVAKNMLNRITIIVTNKLTSNTFPMDGERVYYITKTNLKMNDKLNLSNGNWYVKIISPDIRQYRYSIQLNKINDIVQQNNINIPAPVINKKYALLVGISDYLYINDLQFCDEDMISWCDYLTKLNYEIVLLGDKTSSYGNYTLNDFATEENVRKWIRAIADKVNKDDQFVFISSGHGGGDGKGNSFLCCLDESFQPQGEYTDKEFAADVKLFTNKGAKVIAFFDNCYSGGMLNEVCATNPQNVCATSTCTQNGYGFDMTLYNHGAWTYYFLVKTLCDVNNPSKNITDAFYKALKIYPFSRDHLPQILGNGKLMF